MKGNLESLTLSYIEVSLSLWTAVSYEMLFTILHSLIIQNIDIIMRYYCNRSPATSIY